MRHANHIGTDQETSTSDFAPSYASSNVDEIDQLIAPTPYDLVMGDPKEAIPPTVTEYLELSQAAYVLGKGTATAPNGWTIIDSQPQKASGMEAVAFQNTETKQIVIAYEGTNLDDSKDYSKLLTEQLLTDAQIGLGLPLQANADALEFDRDVVKLDVNNNPIYVTGHSLGGEEAEYVQAQVDEGAPGAKSDGGAAFGGPGVPKQGTDTNNKFTDYINNGDIFGAYVPADGSHVGQVKDIGNTLTALVEDLLAAGAYVSGESGAAGIVIANHLLSAYAFALNVTLPTTTLNPNGFGAADFAELGSINGIELYGAPSAPTYHDGTLTVNGDSISNINGLAKIDLYDGQTGAVLTSNNEKIDATKYHVGALINGGSDNFLYAGSEAQALLVDDGASSSFFGGSGVDTFLGDGSDNTIDGGKGADVVDIDFGSNGNTIASGKGINTVDYTNSSPTSFLLQASNIKGQAFMYSALTAGASLADNLYSIATVDGSSGGSTLTIDPLSSSFWGSVTLQPTLNLGTATTNNQLQLDGSGTSGADYFSVTESTNPDDLFVYAEAGSTDLPSGEGINVANPGKVTVTAGSGNDTLVLNGNLSASIGAGSALSFLGGAGTEDINASGLTSNTTLEVTAGIGAEMIAMGPTQTIEIENPGSYTGTISGFVTGNVIDMAGIGLAQSATLGANNVLNVVESNGETLLLDLSPQANYSGDAFDVASDGNNGTDLTVVAGSPPVTTVPNDVAVFASTTTPLIGVSVADNDPVTLTVVLSDTSGLLSATAAQGGTVSGNDSTSLTLTGLVGVLDTELASLEYAASTGSSDTISVVTTDGLGNKNNNTIPVTIISDGHGGGGGGGANIYWEYEYSASWDKGYWDTGYYNDKHVWVPGPPPGPNDNAEIDFPVSVSLGNDAVYSLIVNGGASVTGGNLTVGDTLYLIDGTYNASIAGGTLLNTGGTQYLEYGEICSGTDISTAGGTFEVDGGTISGGTVATSSGTLTLDYGFIQNATLINSGGTFYVSGYNTLSGITAVGPFNLNASDGFTSSTEIDVTNGITLVGANGSGVGTLNLSGGGAFLILDSEVIDNATINLGNATFEDVVGSLTLGSNITLDASGGGTVIGVTNRGTINLSAQGASLQLGGSSYYANGDLPFTNAGVVEVSNGSTVNLNSATNTGNLTIGGSGSTLNLLGEQYADDYFSNTGVVTLNSGVTGNVEGNSSSNFTNTGSLVLNSAVLSVTGTFSSWLILGFGVVSKP